MVPARGLDYNFNWWFVEETVRAQDIVRRPRVWGRIDPGAGGPRAQIGADPGAREPRAQIRAQLGAVTWKSSPEQWPATVEGRSWEGLSPNKGIKA